MKASSIAWFSVRPPALLYILTRRPNLLKDTTCAPVSTTTNSLGTRSFNEKKAGCSLFTRPINREAQLQVQVEL